MSVWSDVMTGLVIRSTHCYLQQVVMLSSAIRLFVSLHN